MSNKEELLYSICRTSLTTITERVAAVAESSSPESRLRNMCMEHVIAALEDRDEHAVMLAELKSLSDDHRREILGMRNRHEQLFVSVIRADRAAGRLRKDVEPRFLMLALFGMANWTVFWFKDDEGVTAPELAALFVTIYLDGARSGSAS
jgi:AcrR family transcriptional regulator